MATALNLFKIPLSMAHVCVKIGVENQLLQILQQFIRGDSYETGEKFKRGQG